MVMGRRALPRESQEFEMVSVGLGTLVNGARKTGSRVSALLSSMTNAEALDLVVWAVYGDDDPKRDRLVGSREGLYPFEILRGGDPLFKHWQAILIEEDACERFIYRRIGQSVFEARWNLGTFKKTVLQAQTDLKVIREPVGLPV